MVIFLMVEEERVGEENEYAAGMLHPRGPERVGIQRDGEREPVVCSAACIPVQVRLRSLRIMEITAMYGVQRIGNQQDDVG